MNNQLYLENKDYSEYNFDLYEDLKKVCYERSFGNYNYVVKEVYATGNCVGPEDYVYARRFEIDIMNFDGSNYSKGCSTLDDFASTDPTKPNKKRRDNIEILRQHMFYQSITDEDKPHYLSPTKYGHSFFSNKFISLEYAIDLIEEHIEWTKTIEYKELMKNREAA